MRLPNAFRMLLEADRDDPARGETQGTAASEFSSTPLLPGKGRGLEASAPEPCFR